MPKNNTALTMSQDIYTRLKQAIISNKLKPSQRIQEKEIAVYFHSSTVPVREAIRKLADEGFIEISPYRQAVIRGASPKDLQDMSEVMILLDSHALPEAVALSGKEDVLAIAALTKEMEGYGRVETLEDFMKLNARIHERVWSVIPNKFLYSTLLQVYDHLQRYAYIHHSLFAKEGALDASIREHRKLSSIIRSKDTGAIKRLVRDHWKL